MADTDRSERTESTQPAGGDTENPKATPTGNAAKDPDDWVTGEEPMTGAQASYLTTLAEEAGEAPPTGLTKAEASKRIDELQERTGRGSGGD